MRFEFFKILKSKHADDLISWKLYMNTLEYFRNNEGNDAQNDCEEGTCGTITKNQLCQFGIDLPKEFLKITGDSVILVNDYYGLNNIYCLYRLYIDDDRKVVQLPSADLYNFDGDDGESKVVIHFTDTDEFLRRVENALDKRKMRSRDERLFRHTGFATFLRDF